MMNPFRLALITLACAFVVSAIPYAVDRASLARSSRGTISPTELTQQEEVLAATPLYLNARQVADLPSLSELAERQPTVSIPADTGATAVADNATPEAAPAATDKTAVAALPAAAPPPVFDADIAQAQELLEKAGYSPGKVDGLFGQKTRSAIEQFQKTSGMVVTGTVDDQVLKRLAQAVREAKPDTLVAQTAPTPERAATPQAVAMLPKPAETTAGETPQPETAAAVSEPLPEPRREAQPTMVASLPAQSLPAPQNLEVSTPAPSPSAELVLNPEVVVRVESAMVSTSPTLETPVTVSKEILDGLSKEAAVAAAPDGATSDAVAGADTAKTEAGRQERLDREMKAAQAKVAATDFGARPEVSTLAPLAPGSINKLIETANRTGNDDTEPKKDNNVLVAKQTSAPKPALTGKTEAEAKVARVEKVYQQLRTSFPEQLKKGELAETMAKVQAGYTAMKEDMEKGNYTPIVEKGDGFKLAIDNLLSDAAKAYVEGNLKDKAVRAKLKKSDLAGIEKLQADKKYVAAAESLQKLLKTASTKRGGRS